MKKVFFRINFFAVLAACYGFNFQALAQNEADTYLRKVANKCLHSYFQIPGWESCIACESFVLDKDGTASQIKILKHPLNFRTKKDAPAADTALVLAVKNASPFDKPPDMIRTPVKLTLTIDGTANGKPLQARVDIN